MKKIRVLIRNYKKRITKNKTSVLLFILIFSVFIFSRFYQIEEKGQFHIDQVTDAWVVKNFIVDGKIPTLGTQSRLNSGIFMGPLYYYYLGFFYLLTGLDPVAAVVSSSVAGVITLLTIFYVSKKLFSVNFALIASTIYTISYAAMVSDRIPWTVNFLVPVSLFMFYALYKVVTGQEKYLTLLGFVLGLSFHVHFTSVFYIVIILAALPFFPRTRSSIKYYFYGGLAFFIVMLPTIYYILLNRGGVNLVSYLENFYHGFHLRRIIQILPDAFIQFEQILFFPQLKILGPVLVPVFALIYFKEKLSKERILLVYLMILWFLVPWFILATYSGEITDYYFQIGRPIVILILTYFLYQLMISPWPVPKLLFGIIIVVYAYMNFVAFTKYQPRSLSLFRKDTLKKIENHNKISFSEGSPTSYLYYFYILKNDPKATFWDGK